MVAVGEGPVELSRVLGVVVSVPSSEVHAATSNKTPMRDRLRIGGIVRPR